MNDAMENGYIEAIYFTDTGDTGQPDYDAELSLDTKREARAACHLFKLACNGEIDLSQYDPAQLGHDLWLTRNGHGTGFWDRVDIYGPENARIFTLMAHAMGEHYADFEYYDSNDDTYDEYGVNTKNSFNTEKKG